MKLNTKKIMAELKRLDWNYVKLAKEMGISRQLVHYYLHSAPSIVKVEKLAKALNIDSKDLLI